MSVRPVLGLLLGMLLTAGCASSSQEDTGGDDSALRALQAGDIDIPALTSTPAVNVPEKFADIKSWTVDYVEMADPIPDNNFKGLMMFAKDANGETVYMAPFGYIGVDAVNPGPGAPTTAIFNMATDDEGSLIPVTFAFSATNTADKIAKEHAALDWLVAEQQRLLVVMKEQGDASQTTTLGGVHPQFSFWGNAAFCAAHVGAMFLAANPLTYFIADGAISIVEGVANGAYDMQKGVRQGGGGVMMAGTGLAGKAIVKGVTAAAAKGLTGEAAKAATAAAATKLATKGKVLGVVGVGAAVVYNMSTKGVTGGLIQTAKDLIPQSCRDGYSQLTSK